jgi:hypothetical protein
MVLLQRLRDAGIVILTLKALLLTRHTVLSDSVSRRGTISIISAVSSPRGLTTEYPGSSARAACDISIPVDAIAATAIAPL